MKKTLANGFLFLGVSIIFGASLITNTSEISHIVLGLLVIISGFSLIYEAYPNFKAWFKSGKGEK